MATRTGAKPYRICIRGLQHPQQVSTRVFRRFIALGWIIALSARMAEPRPGVEAWLEDGRIRLQDRKAGVEVSIPCSWAWVEKAALYNTSGPRVGSREYERDIQRYHCER